MLKFQSVIAISPLGLMYGSAGGFLSQGNLVGRSNRKFPPDAAAIAGLIFHANCEQKFSDYKELQKNLVVAGPFWAERDYPTRFYVPIPWHRVIAEKEADEWILVNKKSGIVEADTSGDGNWCLNQQKWKRKNRDLKPTYSWQSIDDWDVPLDQLKHREAIANPPWEYVPFLHPKMKSDERHVVDSDGLFLENAIQLSEHHCLVYLSSLDIGLSNGWYRFGGEGHMVEVKSHPLESKHKINRLLERKIDYACALITPGVWGSNSHSYRYPNHPSFPKQDLKMLTDKAVPYRYRIGQSRNGEDDLRSDNYNPQKTGRLSRGRYAVPAGSVYVFKQPLDKNWWDFPKEWFPKEGFPLKHLGCGLCLPIEIQGVPKCTEKLTA